MAAASSTRPNLQPNVELGFYCRIAKLLLSVGTHALRQLFVHQVGDVGVYLKNQNVVSKLKAASPKCFTPYQWKLISPPGATADVAGFDITLLAALLIIVGKLSDGQKGFVREIRQHRNALCHSHDATITKAEFETKWTKVSDTLCNIAGICGQPFRDEIEKEITDLKAAPIDVDREQRHFQVLIELCLSDRDFQQDILTLQAEANRQLQQIRHRLRLLEQRPELRQMVKQVDELNKVMKECVESNENKAAICSLLMEDMNSIIDSHLSSFQKEIRADLKSISQRVDGATELLQGNRQDLKRMEMKLDNISQSKPVVNLIDGDLIDKFADGFKQIPSKIVKTLTPNKDVPKPTKKTDEKKKSEEKKHKQHRQDEQIRYYEIAVKTQDQLLASAILEFSLTDSGNTKDSKNVTSRQEPEMDEDYRAEIEKGLQLELARGVGPDTVLLLDGSCNMKQNENFSKMMTLTRQIIQGIVEESVPKVLEENVAIVTFGSLTTVRQHLTNDQCNWITCLEEIENSGPNGPADLCKGLRMCEAALQINKNPMEKHGFRISPRLILISDGNISDSSDPSEPIQNREKARQQAYELMDLFTRNNHKVFCMPLCSHGSPAYSFLEKLAHRASGSVVRPDEIQFITRYHRKILWALLIESCHPGIIVSQSSFIEDILNQSKLPFTAEEVEDMKEIIANPESLGYTRSGSKTSRYEEHHDDLPPLGTRIIQGEHWREDEFKEHHCGPGTGTVIGQDDGSVWVEWDGCEDGMHYKYKYGLHKFFEVMVHNRPRTPEEGKTFPVGCCITRIEWDEDELEDRLGYGLVFISNPRFKTFGARWKNGDIMYHKYSSNYYVHEEIYLTGVAEGAGDAFSFGTPGFIFLYFFKFPSPWCFGPQQT